jgi:hypothetical protein
VTLVRNPLVGGPQQNVADQMGYRHLQALGMGTFSAHKNADQTGLPDASTQITFDDEEYNPSNWYDVANSRFLPRLAGYYRFNCQLFFDNGKVGKHVTLMLHKNGTHYKVLDHRQMGTTDDFLVTGTGIVKSDGNDYWEIFVSHNSAPDTLDITVPADAEEANYFEGELIAIQGA